MQMVINGCLELFIHWYQAFKAELEVVSATGQGCWGAVKGAISMVPAHFLVATEIFNDDSPLIEGRENTARLLASLCIIRCVRL